ncbi:transcriptional regulator [Microbulbifer sp. TYP-18]|uniref:transcriptional regulator n=1 Tax=Microbulbifer sp. TYP-18 TaxID=3230024 RepID=UPI0034C5E79B
MEGFKPYIEIAEGLCAVFGTNLEVVLHDLASERIVHIAGGFSKRNKGDPSLLNTIDFDENSRVIGPYEKTNWDGRRIRSVTNVLRDDKGRAFGLMCVNFDLSPITEAVLALQNLAGPVALTDQPEALFRDDWHERINQFIANWTARHKTAISNLDRVQKRQLVRDLDAEGAFKAPGAILYAARIVGLGRATIYKYLQEPKIQKAE